MAELEAFCHDGDVPLLKHSTATPAVAYCKQRLVHMTHHTCNIYWNDSGCGVNVIPFTTCVHMQLHISNHMARPPCSPQ